MNNYFLIAKITLALVAFAHLLATAPIIIFLATIVFMVTGIAFLKLKHSAMGNSYQIQKQDHRPVDANYNPAKAPYSAELLKIIELLASFNLTPKHKQTIEGLSVITYIFEMPPGIAYQRIKSLEGTIGMHFVEGIQIQKTHASFAVQVAKTLNKRTFIPLEKLIALANEQCKGMSMPLYIGVDVYNNPLVADLADLHHLLIAGSSGGGKSVLLNCLIEGLLRKTKGIQINIIDPKKVEFGKFAHRANVVTEIEPIIELLGEIVAEMNNRYLAMKAINVANIAQYNKHNSNAALTPIVTIIDEFAELTSMKKEATDIIDKIARLGRAAGVHLICATQRPTVSVITGNIKANMSRIALKCQTAVDSQTILGSKGAETLTGKGDLLFKHEDTFVRAQSAYLP